MATPQTNIPANKINTPGFVSAYKIDPATGLPVGGIPDLGYQPPTPQAPAPKPVTRYTTPPETAPVQTFGPTTFSADEAEKIREATRQRYQTIIDSVNLQFQSAFKTAERQGLDRLGQNRARQARGGITDSPMGESQTTGVEVFNREQVQQLEAEKGARIAAIFNQMDDSAEKEIRSRREEALQNYEMAEKSRKEIKDESRNNLLSLAQAGLLKFEELTPEQQGYFQRNTGWDSLTMEAIFEINKPKAEQRKFTWDTRKDGSIIRFADDGTVKVFEDYKLPAEVDAQIVNTDSGEVLFIDKNDPYNTDGSVKYQSLGKYSKPVKLTADEKGDIASGKMSALDPSAPDYTENVLAASAGGKNPAVAERQAITKSFNVINQLDLLTGNITKEDTGPIVGYIKSKNPYDTKAQLIKAQLTAIVPNLARGVFGEVGVLTDNDVALYSKTMANLTSTPDVNKAVQALTLKTVQRSIENQLQTMAASGLDVSGFKNQYLNVKNTVSRLEGELGLKSEAGSGSFTVNTPDGPISFPDQKSADEFKKAAGL